MTEAGPGHAYSHVTGQPRTAQLRALSWALGVNVGLLVVEAVGGLVFHSLALFADAAQNDRGVDVIISGGMGGGAINIFNSKGIEVIVGASGVATDAAEAYLKGTLKSTGSVCHEHQRCDEPGH